MLTSTSEELCFERPVAKALQLPPDQCEIVQELSSWIEDFCIKSLAMARYRSTLFQPANAIHISALPSEIENCAFQSLLDNRHWWNDWCSNHSAIQSSSSLQIAEVLLLYYRHALQNLSDFVTVPVDWKSSLDFDVDAGMHERSPGNIRSTAILLRELQHTPPTIQKLGKAIQSVVEKVSLPDK